MNEILIVKDFFESTENLVNFFTQRKLRCITKSVGELNTTNLPKSILIGSKKFEEKINGKSNLIKISRNIGCKKIIILNKKENSYEMQTDLGGSYMNITSSELDEAVKEILLNTVCDQNFLIQILRLYSSSS